MRNVAAIAQRELLAFFCSPVAYIVIAGFLLINGVLVLSTDTFAPGKPAQLQDIFAFMPWILTVIVPAISMRLLADEYRAGTIETLMTAPLTDTQMVLGKFVAAFVFFVVMLATTLIYALLMELYGNPDWSTAFSTYLGVLLIGMTFMAWGLLASSLTSNQVVAWILGWVPLLLFACLAYFIVTLVSGWSRTLFQQVNVIGRFGDFSRGLIKLDGVVFFLGTTVLFLFLTVKVVESRRWR